MFWFAHIFLFFYSIKYIGIFLTAISYHSFPILKFFLGRFWSDKMKDMIFIQNCQLEISPLILKFIYLFWIIYLNINNQKGEFQFFHVFNFLIPLFSFYFLKIFKYYRNMYITMLYNKYYYLDDSLSGKTNKRQNTIYIID